MSNAGRGILRLEGDCGLRKSAELVAEITKTLALENEIVIDATAAAAADISTVQILVAAHKSAQAAGKTLRVHAPPESSLGDVLAKGGFIGPGGGAVAPQDSPWVGEPLSSSGDAA